MALSLDRKFTRQTTAERVSFALRDAIMAGYIPPGRQLVEHELREALGGVSRNTIREALRLLAKEGLVRHDPHRGVRVARLSEQDVHDIFTARTTLELAGIDAISSVGPEHLDQLRAADDAFEHAVDAGDWVGAFDADLALHGALVNAIPSERLHQFFAGIFNELRLGYFVVGGLETESLPADRHDHRAIVESVTVSDFDRCRTIVADHLAESEQLLLKLMRECEARQAEPDLGQVIADLYSAGAEG